MSTVLLDIIGASCIRVGERPLSPSSPLLFGAVLYLSIETTRDITRDELQELLFSERGSQSTRAHNVRQLLYRLRALGCPITSSANCVRFDSKHVRPALASIESLSPAERARLPEPRLAVLPGYNPAITKPFADWVDTTRATLRRSLRRLFERDLASSQHNSDWESSARFARQVLSIDPRHYSALKAFVEACALRHDHAPAISAIDDFLADCTSRDSATEAELLRTRRRLASRVQRMSPLPLVGREPTLATLAATWRKAQQGSSQYLVVTGPAGIGKTRLASAICELASAQGARVIEYRCGDNDHHRPLALFARLGGDLLSLPGALGISPDAFALLSRLARSDGAAQPSACDPIKSEIVRADLHDALIDLFDAVTTETRLLLAVDDAHRLDTASWSVLRELMARVKHRRAMLVLCSRSTVHIQRQAALLGCRVLPLEPLSDADSRQLLAVVAPSLTQSEAALNEVIRLAGGNPFFIQAIARHSQGAARAPIPRDIADMAASSYHSLDGTTRTVLEVVLLLRDLATVQRVRSISVVEEGAFLSALRLLEEEGLVACTSHKLRASHDLLAEALLHLIPRSVAALIRQRVAEQLEAECAVDGFDVSLAWAAADAWLALGNGTAAARLLRRCAAQAAALGENFEAARILFRLLEVSLAPPEAIPVLQDLIRYADDGGERSIRARASRELLRLYDSGQAEELRLNSEDLASLRIAVAEADQNEAGDLQATIAEARTVLDNDCLDPELRLRAGVTLLIAADFALDSSLAERCWRSICALIRRLGTRHTQALRAKLIYHTVFANRATAIATARRILALHDLSTLALASVNARRNALFALQVLGETRVYETAAATTYAFMAAAKVHTEALYACSAMAERAVAQGRITDAVSLLAKGLQLVPRLQHTSQGVVQGYLSVVAFVAMLSGDFDGAAGLLTQVGRRLRLVRTPRIRAIDTAHHVRLAWMARAPMPGTATIAQLREDYEAGSRLGRQDTVVESLWMAYTSRGDAVSATRLLTEYLASRRREVGPTEWSLWHFTQTDPAWKRHGRAKPPVAHDLQLPVTETRSLVKQALNICS